MMKHKTIVKVAVLMVVVFGVTTLLYPMIYNPDAKTKAPIDIAPPVDYKPPVVPIPVGR